MPYKILLHDDDERFRKVVLAGLRSKDVGILEAANGADAFSAAENAIREVLETFKASLSAGLARFPLDFDSSYELLRVADKRLYEAKARGRKRVVTDTPISIES